MSIGPADAAALAGRRDGNRAPLLDLQGRCGNASPFVHWHLHEVIGRALSVVRIPPAARNGVVRGAGCTGAGC